MGIVVFPASVEAITSDPNFSTLSAEYAAEGALTGLPDPKPRIDQYFQLEKAGMLNAIGAYADGVLIGFVAVFMPLSPHYGVQIAATESLFVTKKHRAEGVRTQLIDEAFHIARLAGAAGLMVNAPVTGTLAHTLPNSGFRKTHELFFKSTASA